MSPHASMMALLRRLGACDPALEWCETQPDLATAWERCGEPDWMLWLLQGLAFRTGVLAPTAYRDADAADDNAIDVIDDGMSFREGQVSRCYAIRAAIPYALIADAVAKLTPTDAELDRPHELALAPGMERTCEHPECAIGGGQ